MREAYSATQSLPLITFKKLMAVRPHKESLKGSGVCFVFSNIDWKHALYTFSSGLKTMIWSFVIHACKNHISKGSLTYFLLLKKGQFSLSALLPQCLT